MIRQEWNQKPQIKLKQSSKLTSSYQWSLHIIPKKRNTIFILSFHTKCIFLGKHSHTSRRGEMFGAEDLERYSLWKNVFHCIETLSFLSLFCSTHKENDISALHLKPLVASNECSLDVFPAALNCFH